MSKEALTWYRRQCVEDNSVSSVLEELARRHFSGSALFPSQRALADATNLSARTVWTSLHLLQHFGVIKRSARYRPHEGRTSDRITLSFARDFTITKAAMRGARALMTPSQKLRAPLAKSAKDNKYSKTKGPIQEENSTEEIGNTRGAIETRSTLRLIRGGLE